MHDIAAQEPAMLLQSEDGRTLLQRKATYWLRTYGRRYAHQGFSKGFAAWAASDEPATMHRATNGCLMRQSPIAEEGLRCGYTEQTIQELALLFAAITHNHPDALKSVRSHMFLLTRVLQKTMSHTEFQVCVENDPHVEICTAKEWAARNAKKFIWDAPTSLSIACSNVYYAHSFETCVQQSIACHGDTDTYAAIAGPIAQSLWGITPAMMGLSKKYVKTCPDILRLYPALQ